MRVNEGQTLQLADVEVARIGLGTNRLTNTPEHVALIKDAVAAGVRVIDTAHTYAGGESEATIGAALSALPDDVVVATKGERDGQALKLVRYTTGQDNVDEARYRRVL